MNKTGDKGCCFIPMLMIGFQLFFGSNASFFLGFFSMASRMVMVNRRRSVIVHRKTIVEQMKAAGILR